MYVTPEQFTALATANRDLRLERTAQGKLIVNPPIRRRFGELSSGLEQQLQTLSISQLEDLAEALLDFNNLNDLSHWLENQEQ